MKPQAFGWLRSVGGLALVVSIWYLADFLQGPSGRFPDPDSVLAAVTDIVGQGESYEHVSKTIYRTLNAFSLSLIIAVVVGVTAGYNKLLADLINPVVVVGLTVPAICWTAISVMLFGISDWTAIFAATVIVSPVMTSSILSEVKTLDNDLISMSRVYRVKTSKVLREVVFPQVLPAFFFGVQIRARSLLEGDHHRGASWPVRRCRLSDFLLV